MPKPKIQPRLPKGMRDFLPQEMIKREYVFNVVREVFHLYGFEPLQTPVLELHETLMGKYGEDAEKLIFNAQHPGGKEELALRYDLSTYDAAYLWLAAGLKAPLATLDRRLGEAAQRHLQSLE